MISSGPTRSVLQPSTELSSSRSHHGARPLLHHLRAMKAVAKGHVCSPSSALTLEGFPRGDPDSNEGHTSFCYASSGKSLIHTGDLSALPPAVAVAHSPCASRMEPLVLLQHTLV